jgi:aminoglycoside phosphotransferase (APT) family kinase protein
MDQSYNVIAGVVALAIAVAIIVWICEGGSSPFPSFFAHDDLPKLAGIAEH